MSRVWVLFGIAVWALGACPESSSRSVDASGSHDTTLAGEFGSSDAHLRDGISQDRSAVDSARLDATAAPSCTAPTDHSLRLFFIGNSFTLGGPIPVLVRDLAVNAGFPRPDVEYSAVGGYTLSKHRLLKASTEGVAKGAWDVVVLQEYSTKPTDAMGDPLDFKRDATWFYDKALAASPAAEVVLYETWARHPDHGVYPTQFKDPAEMQAQLRKHYNDAADHYIPDHATASPKDAVTVAPAGDAWEKHLAEPKALRLHASDNYHAGPKGQYLNALVIFSTIYGCRTIDLAPLLSLSATEASRLQASADATTGQVGVPPGAVPPVPSVFPVGAVLRIDLGPTTTSDPGWNNLTSSTGKLIGPITTSGMATSVTVTITDSFSGANTSGRPDNTLGWPASVSSDTLWVGSFDGHALALGNKGQVSIGALPAGTYTVSLFGSRKGKDGAMDRLTRYTVAGATKDLEATDNRSDVATFTGVKVGGAQTTLAIDVAVSPVGTGRFAYLNELEITRTQ